MANSSLTAEPCSHNDVDVVSLISGLIISSHRYYATQKDFSLVKFICLLKTVVGLGFTACLAAGYDATNYHIYFLRFIQYRFGNPEESMTKPKFVDSFAKMVELALSSFCTLGYPDYYKSFTQAITEVINKPEVKTSTQSKQAQQLLKLLNRGNRGG